MAWKQRVPNPTRKEIMDRAAKIREKWSDHEHHKRYVGPLYALWAIPLVNIIDMPEGFCNDDGQDQTNPR